MRTGLLRAPVRRRAVACPGAGGRGAAHRCTSRANHKGEAAAGERSVCQNNQIGGERSLTNNSVDGDASGGRCNLQPAHPCERLREYVDTR